MGGRREEDGRGRAEDGEREGEGERVMLLGLRYPELVRKLQFEDGDLRTEDGGVRSERRI
jgi:hypothetical protein